MYFSNKIAKFKIEQMLLFKSIVIAVFIFYFSKCYTQQMPYYTQYNLNSFALNPAIAGTKRIIDARTIYRNQWTGFENSPITKGFSINGKLADGKMGLGLLYFNDLTGPTKRSNFSLAYAYHLRFEDVELSFGVSGQSMTYFIDGSKINLHFPQDHAIDLLSSQKKNAYNAGSGAYLYNDRFFIGISFLNLISQNVDIFPKEDTTHFTKLHMITHTYGCAGVKWSNDQNWVFENLIQVAQATANPMTIDFCMRLHYKQKVFGGLSIRPQDMVALHFGATFWEDFHFSYSYDIPISPLNAFNYGTHELIFAWSSNLGIHKKDKYVNTDFRKQKYGFIF